MEAMDRMKIIAGLGNPGSEYANTKHNVGFMFVDALADKLGIDGCRRDNRLNGRARLIDRFSHPIPQRLR